MRTEAMWSRVSTSTAIYHFALLKNTSVSAIMRYVCSLERRGKKKKTVSAKLQTKNNKTYGKKRIEADTLKLTQFCN